MDNQMIIEKVSPYDFGRTVELLIKAAGEKQWEIPAVHDLQQSLAKSGKSVKPVKVIELCKPEYSGDMLEKNDERIVSVMMPCRISVYTKDDGSTYLALLNITAMSAGLPENIKTGMIKAASEISQLIEELGAAKNHELRIHFS